VKEGERLGRELAAQESQSQQSKEQKVVDITID
jgi:hypothetical protein